MQEISALSDDTGHGVAQKRTHDGVIRRHPSTLANSLIIPLMAVCLSGCYIATGDFGRREQNIYTEKILPGKGREAAKLRGEPVSNFNMTDDERQLRNRADYLRSPPHYKDWLGYATTKKEANRVYATFGAAHAPNRYYKFLRSDKFLSSETRYERLRFDITSDIELIPPFCTISRKVLDADRERILATRRSRDLSEEETENAYGRVYENDLVISNVEAALNYRVEAYKYAIEHLEIETPSDQIWVSNRAVRQLQANIAMCRQELKQGPAALPVAHRRSRIYTGPYDEEPVYQK